MKISSLRTKHFIVVVLCALVGATAAFAAAAPSDNWNVPGVGSVHDADTGALLYYEHRAALRDGDRMVNIDVRYESPQGESLGRRSLDFGDERYQPAVTLEATATGYAASLSKADRRWTGTRREDADARDKKFWPRIRANSIIDEALYPYLGAARQEILRGELKSVNVIWLGAGAVRSYDLQARQSVRDGVAVVQVDLSRAGWFADDTPEMVLEFDVRTGALRRYEGVPTCLCVAPMPSRVQIRYAGAGN